MKLIAFRLQADSHPYLIDALRRLYNESIPFMTKPLEENSAEEQLAWWRSLDHSKVLVHLYSPVDEPWKIVAYSMLQHRGDHASPMFAIDPTYWGRGYGRAIIAHYIKEARMPLRGEQLVENKPIRHLNEKAGWKVIGNIEGRVELLEHSGEPTRDQEILDEIVRYHGY